MEWNSNIQYVIVNVCMIQYVFEGYLYLTQSAIYEEK